MYCVSLFPDPGWYGLYSYYLNKRTTLTFISKRKNLLRDKNFKRSEYQNQNQKSLIQSRVTGRRILRRTRRDTGETGIGGVYSHVYSSVLSIRDFFRTKWKEGETSVLFWFKKVPLDVGGDHLCRRIVFVEGLSSKIHRRSVGRGEVYILNSFFQTLLVWFNNRYQ